jgi:hypothetical protein
MRLHKCPETQRGCSTRDLVLFNHIALGHEKLFLEYIPHLKDYFIEPAIVEGGVYLTPQGPGSSSALTSATAGRG